MNGALAGRVAVIGSGIAGLVTALELAPRPVVLITQAGLGEASSTALAQGGIAAALAEGDSVESHIADTLAAGDGLCDAPVVERILRGTPDAIAMLVRHGVRFDRGASGFSFGLEAAHAHHRILHAAGDGTGAEISRALVAAVLTCPSITVLAGAQVRRLLTRDGQISGVLLARDGRAEVLLTSQVVMATGGIGGLYDTTTSPVSNFGQGVAMAARAGAALADMEFVQFHPTALALGQGRVTLISEAVRGEGAILLNDRGERFMADQPGAELAPRDVVARAIHQQIADGRRVFLDARQALGDRFAVRFPGIARLCAAAALDPARDAIPVRPAVHYHMGGIWTDTKGRTTLPGLWAVGECASTGLHGANRLASNSLLEGAVVGMRAAESIAATRTRPLAPAPKGIELPEAAHTQAVRGIVSRHLGIVRDGASLRQAMSELLPMGDDAAIVALSIATFAALRDESRGAHSRLDFPAQVARPSRRRMVLDDILRSARLLTQTRLVRSA
ncbi:L-aspartate oxidase [Paracoccus caeni]|uniref:L-aspartate oxidase n=1 Tax=Paracoccus caeni TaxID=657651 RepID=A0A934W236_9RHOB|nr:L-aspartate oxidase [Paracoccus caeni]MBK4218013.1 L-aspartate oxidase [Paracoccus caeni]